MFAPDTDSQEEEEDQIVEVYEPEWFSLHQPHTSKESLGHEVDCLFQA